MRRFFFELDQILIFRKSFGVKNLADPLRVKARVHRDRSRPPSWKPLRP